MTKYVRAKKYLRVLVPVLIVLGAILVPKLDRSPKGETLGVSSENNSGGNLRVSQSGQTMYADVTADNLQPAAAPERSATSSSLSPQQAVPNYCAPGERPIIDGCLSQ